MENKILISVIVPTYNSETVVPRAAESVIKQMNDRVELILVNDGSTDNSGAVCDNYSKRYPGVKVVHKVNGGLASARNAGMAVATGEYFVFLDADDYLALNTCEELIKVINTYHPDCIDFGWNYVGADGELTPNLHKVQKNVLLDNHVLRNLILPPLLHIHDDPDHFIYEFSCMKVYRRQIIEENSIYFNEELRIWEDRPFVCHYLKYCRNFYSMDQYFYHYVFTEGSLGQRFSMDFFWILVWAFRHYKNLFEDEYDFDTPYVNSYWCGAAENIIRRGLVQTQNAEIIREKILNFLREEQVIHWYRNREPADAFQKRINALVVAGEVEKALRLYTKKVAQGQRKQDIRNVWQCIKNNLKMLRSKLVGE